MNFRYDIQALRGYAVLIILLFHAGIGPFQAGYLGVDIFFVISGFLITGMIVRQTDEDRFSFREFYYRRAKRLLPAVYVVLFFTIIGSYFFLNTGEFNKFKNQVLGAVTFSINFTLKDQADYFAGSAEFKPLLHMWSLAIEEQFYLLLPLILYFTPKRFRIFTLGTLLGGSLLACVLLIDLHQREVFYLLPTRAWELLIGGMGAIYAGKLPQNRLVNQFGLSIALAALIILPIFPISPLHPSIDAILVCLATLGVILTTKTPTKPPKWPVRSMGVMGDYSYSLYLVHWPLYAFAANAYMGDEIPLEIRAALLVTTVILAYALYQTIENPIHKATYQKPRRLVIVFVLSAIGLMGLTLAVKTTYRTDIDYKLLMRANVGLEGACDQRKSDYTALPACQTSDAPEIMVWGDSFAMHFVPGLIKQDNHHGVIQATRSSCAPFLDISYYDNDKYTKAWAKECIKFNHDVLATLQTMPSVKYVLLSTPISSNISAENDGVRYVSDGQYDDIKMNKDVAFNALKRTVAAIHKAGKKAVFISPLPQNGYDVGQCLERQATGKMTFGHNKNCTVRLSIAKEKMHDIHHFLDRAKNDRTIAVIDLSDSLCRDDMCDTTINDVFLYRDTQHISVFGSVELANKIDLMELIKKTAR